MSIKKFDTLEEYWDRGDIDQALLTADSSSLGAFKEILSSYLNVRNFHATPTGRQGIYWLLENVKQLLKPRMVLVSSFNCESVAEAIKKSGHQQ